MKRIGNIWSKIIDIENIKEAHRNAKRDKSFYKEVKMVDENLDYYAEQIHLMLKNKTYKVSRYRRQVINDKGKERVLLKLQYYPDRIIQWAILLQLSDVFNKNFCKHTCASLPKRGIKRAKDLIKCYLKDQSGSKYCLKLDIKKFYDSIDRSILKKQLRHKIKDKDLLWLLDLIIDSCPNDKGVPIGSYLSQYLANFYLSSFDHYLKEQLRIKYCVRYMDDVVILSYSKKKLHNILVNVKDYVCKLNLELNNKYQIFSVGCRGVDFVGFRFFHHFTLLRKKSLKRLKRICLNVRDKWKRKLLMTYKEFCGINAYCGWLEYCDSYRLKQKYFKPIKNALLHFYIVYINNDETKRYRYYIRFSKKLSLRMGGIIV